MKRVVITGMGAITPIGNNLSDFWQHILLGHSGAGPITRFDTEKFKTKFACEVKGFNPLNYMEKGDVRKYDLFTQYALAATDEAVQHAQIDFQQLNLNRIGVIWGSGNGGFQTFHEQVTEYATGDGTPRFNPYFIPKVIVDIASGVISIKYGLRGINFTTVSACASSTTAIIDAFNYIRWGKADMIITGGSDAAITPSGIGGFNACKALSTNNEQMLTASRPFDKTRDGFVMGEGAGAIVLEEYEHAVRRQAPIIAEIAGGGMAADAYHLTATHPEGEGAYLGMMAAAEDAGVAPHVIDYINAHATSTPLGDTSELIAIKRLLQGDVSKVHISGTKSATGHLLGAAGVIEAILAIQAVQHNIVPPTINTQEVDSAIDAAFQLTLHQPVQKTVHYALSNTFGFGGHIASVLFKKVDL